MNQLRSPKNKIFIPTTGAPKIITNEMEEFESIIKCERAHGTAISYLDHFGYRLAVFFDDSFLLKDLPMNSLCSIIVKEKGSAGEDDAPFYGNCILIDDYKELTIEDLSKIVKIARAIPSSDWIPETSIENFLNMKPERSDYYKMLRRHMVNYVRRNPKQVRLEVWDKVKEYHVPPSDDSDDE